MSDAATFESHLTLLFASDADDRPERAASLYAELRRAGHIPLVVGQRVWFLFHGKAERVAVTGDWTGWRDAQTLHRVDASELFVREMTFPVTARLQYKLLVDGAAVVDPGNPRLAREGFGVNSEFVMPQYRDRSYIEPPPEPIERGAITSYSFKSRILGERRILHLYLPATSLAAGALPLLVIHDGGEALEIGGYDRIIDHLIWSRRVLPFAALFLPPVSRNDEYALNMTYARFCVREALPKATALARRSGIAIATHPRQRCILGASLAGLLATATALRWPELIGSCIAQSPAYWWNRGEIFSLPTFRNAGGLRVILQTGTICDAREMTQLMYQKMRLAGASVTYREYEQGHTWGNWRSNLADGIMDWMGTTHIPATDDGVVAPAGRADNERAPGGSGGA